jgi:hypothetical protein
MSIALTIFSGDGYRLSQPAAPYRSSTRRVLVFAVVASTANHLAHLDDRPVRG